MEFLKNQKLLRGKANMQIIGAHRQPLSRSFGTNETQQLREGQLVGRMLLQRRETSEIQAKAARHSYAHAQYIHNAEFRRAFITLGAHARGLL